MSNKNKLQEFSIIEKYFAPLTEGYSGAFGLQDDVAIIPKNSKTDYVISTDSMVEGVHFPTNSIPAAIASRLMGSNLSDIASVGAVPKFYLLNGSINKKTDAVWLKNFSERLRDFNEEYSINLLGGDTFSSEKTAFFSLTIIGEVEKGKILRRNAAELGDDVYVTGHIGESWIGLQILKGEIQDVSYQDKNYFVNRYIDPTPRIAIGRALSKAKLAKACTDVSDGLLKDLNNLCTVSDVSVRLDKESIPLGDPEDYFLQQISGGDDYELLFTANEKDAAKIKSISKKLNTEITKIGKITENSDKRKRIYIFDQAGDEVKFDKLGYEHEA